MAAYEVTIYGRDDWGHPIAGPQTINADTPALALTEPGWDIRPTRGDERTGEVIGWLIERHDAQLGDILIERSSDPGLWLVSIPGRGWIGTVREAGDITSRLLAYARTAATRDDLIHEAAAEGVPETRIAAAMGIDRMTVRKALGK